MEKAHCLAVSEVTCFKSESQKDIFKALNEMKSFSEVERFNGNYFHLSLRG